MRENSWTCFVQHSDISHHVQRFYHPKQRCAHMLVMTLLAVLWKFVFLHKRRNRSREAASEEMLPLPCVWTKCGKLRGGNRAGWTWPRTVQTNPSPVAWLPLNLGNRTTVGKQDCFKDMWWQFQFSFVTENMWSPWALFNHLDQSTQSLVFSFLAPVTRQCLTDSSKSHGLGLFRKKVPLATHQICWRAQKNRWKSNGHGYCPGSSQMLAFCSSVRLLLHHSALHLPEWNWCHLFAI